MQATAGSLDSYRTVQPGQTVVVIGRPVPPIICDRYPVRQSIGIGISLIIIGILSAIFNGVLFCVPVDFMKYFGHGFWSAFIFVTAGALGVVAGRSKTRGSITGFLVMSIVSACCSAPLVALSVIGAVGARQYYVYAGCNNYEYHYNYKDYTCKNSSDVAIALESMLVICGLIAGVLSILGAFICCKSTCLCCGAAQTSTGVLPTANYYPGVDQMIYLNQAPSTNYFYSMDTQQQSFVVSGPQQTSLGQTNWNQPQSMPASQKPPPYELQDHTNIRDHAHVHTQVQDHSHAHTHAHDHAHTHAHAHAHTHT